MGANVGLISTIALVFATLKARDRCRGWQTLGGTLGLHIATKIIPNTELGASFVRLSNFGDAK